MLDDEATIKIGNDDDLVIHSGSAGTITNDPGDLTFDVAGDIILDADDGDVILKDGGTEIGRFANASSDLVIKSAVSDKDMLLKGNDGGSEITALTLDMSAAGAAAFNSGATFGGAITSNSGVVIDNVTIDGTEIDLSSGDLTIDVAGNITLDAEGNDINLSAAGTNHGRFSNTSSDFVHTVYCI